MTCVGQTYEKKNIEKWLEENNTDPLTNNVLYNKSLTQNHFAKIQIDQWREKHKN